MRTSQRPAANRLTMCVLCIGLLLAPAGLWAQTASGPAPKAATPAPRPASLPTTLPIATGGDKAAQLLKQWWREGTAAGHLGDFYDNRDRGHSEFYRGGWPQLKKVTYTPEQLAIRADWAAQRTLLPLVVFGNSSTSAPVGKGGSNVRNYYAATRGLLFLYAQYTRNNVYIYPEHCDHDPGHNGAGGGYGDLYPTNTPFLIASQGSSGSDQPFLRAVCSTLAAFRPEVKKKLYEAGMLMPTLQMIFRMSNRQVARPEDYLTGKAHPTVFEGGQVDELKMVEMAHAITMEDIPPTVQLAVVREDEPASGKDYFDLPVRTEKHADTPAVIARIWRGMGFTRTMRVSAAGSGDVNARPLTYHWVLLRGDPKTVTIKTEDRGRTADITLSYPYRRPIAEGSAMESNRVDIGVFVHNGTYYSAPGFITFYGLDDEARAYDAAGRLLEIGYGNGDTALQVHWQTLFDQIQKEPDHPALKLLRAGWKEAECAAMEAAGGEYAKLTEASKDAQKKAGELSKAYQKAIADVQELTKTIATRPSDEAKADLAKAKQTQQQAQKVSEVANKVSAAAAKAAEEFVGVKREDLGRSIQEVVMGRLLELVQSPTFLKDHAEALAKTDAGARARNVLASNKKRLAGYGIIKGETEFELTLLEPRAAARGPASGPAGANRDASASGGENGGGPRSSLTAYERCQLKRANAEMLSYLLPPGVFSAPFYVYYVDPRLASPKAWRDVFEYDPAGKIAKWTRYDGQKAQDIDPANPPQFAPPPPPRR